LVNAENPNFHLNYFSVLFFAPWTLLLGATATPFPRPPATPFLTSQAVLLSRIFKNVIFSQLNNKHTEWTIIVYWSYTTHLFISILLIFTICNTLYIHNLYV